MQNGSDVAEVAEVTEGVELTELAEVTELKRHSARRRRQQMCCSRADQCGDGDRSGCTDTDGISTDECDDGGGCGFVATW